MRIEHLRYLVEVADSGSMSRAARNLFVSQPAISNAVAGLEEEIGWPILERTSTGVRPTTKGKLVVDDARLIVRLVQEWNDELDAVNMDKITGDVYVADSGELGMSYFQDTVMKLNRMYPKMTVHAVTLDTSPLKQLNNGRFQLTMLPILPGHHRAVENYLAHYRWHMTALYTENCRLLIPEGSDLEKEPAVKPQMLAGADVLVYPDFPYRRLLESVIPDVNVKYEDPIRLVASVACGDAVGIFPPSQDVLLHEFIEEGVIGVKEIEGVGLPLEINLIYADYFSKTDAGKLIIQKIKEEFSA